MSVLVGLQHVTSYRYDRPVALGPQVIRLRPAPHTRTAIRSYSLKVTPAQHFVNWQQDPNGNWLARFVFPERTTEFSIAVDLLADMSVINPFDFFVDPVATNYPFVYPSEFDEELAPYLSKEPAGPRLTEYLKSLPRAQQSIIDFIVALNQRLQRDIRYLVRMDPGVQSTEDTLTLAVRLMPRLGLAAGSGAAASRPRIAFRVRLSDPVDLRPQGARRAGRHGEGFHRSARLDRSLPAGRRLDRNGSHIRAADRRGPYSARRNAALSARRRRSAAASRRRRSSSPSR